MTCSLHVCSQEMFGVLFYIVLSEKQNIYLKPKVTLHFLSLNISIPVAN